MVVQSELSERLTFYDPNKDGATASLKLHGDATAFACLPDRRSLAVADESSGALRVLRVPPGASSSAASSS